MTFGKGVSRNCVTCFKKKSMSVRENRTYCEKNRNQCIQQSLDVCACVMFEGVFFNPMGVLLNGIGWIFLEILTLCKSNEMSIDNFGITSKMLSYSRQQNENVGVHQSCMTNPSFSRTTQA